jgi:hypothetical protein
VRIITLSNLLKCVVDGWSAQFGSYGWQAARRREGRGEQCFVVLEVYGVRRLDAALRVEAAKPSNPNLAFPFNTIKTHTPKNNGRFQLGAGSVPQSWG